MKLNLGERIGKKVTGFREETREEACAHPRPGGEEAAAVQELWGVLLPR